MSRPTLDEARALIEDARLGVAGGSPDEDQAMCAAIVASTGLATDFPAWAGTEKETNRHG